MDLASQQAVEFTTALTFVLAAVLAIFLTQNYVQRRTKSYLFWSVGLWLFAASVLEEFLFSEGYYSDPLIKSYLGITAVLVESLAIGSILLIKSSRIKLIYYAFSAISTVALVYVIAMQAVGNLIQGFVVFGAIPDSIITVSSVVTFPAAAVLIAIAALTYRRTKNLKMISIIAGVVILSVAGSLYIGQFPAFLYLSGFIGVLLLWFGFFDFASRRKPRVGADVSRQSDSLPPVATK